MSTETPIRARDAFAEYFRPQLKDLIFNLAVGITKVEDKFALAVRCQFEDLDAVTEDTKIEILEILGKSFVFEGDTYLLDIAFMGIPSVQRTRN